MIAENTGKIITDICELHARAGGVCTEWCIGVTDDPERHLFGELGIARDYRWHIQRRALSAKEARAIVAGFRNIGFETSLSGLVRDDDSAVCVFAYRKAVMLDRTAVEERPRV